jgi:hypothetical protein
MNIHVRRLGAHFARCGLAVFGCLFFSVPATAAGASPSPSAPSGSGLVSAWRENLRFTVDLAARGIYDTQNHEFGNVEFLGIDMHKVFSNASGDWGTLLLQPYLTRINNVAMHPPFFDSNYDTQIEFRICNFNYTGLAGGRFNIRVGHFEIPFGLEQVINTNGTLRDYIHGPNFGLKADWGITVNGELPAFEYEVALSRGSGNYWRSAGDPYIVSGRIATPQDRSWSVGLSGFRGDVYAPAEPDGTFRRSRVGLDGQWYWHQFGLLGEVSAGRDESRSVVNALAELDYSSVDGVWLTYLQLRRFSIERPGGASNDSAVSTALGITFDPDNHWSFGLQWSHDFTTFAGAPDSNVIAGQVRYRL